MIGHAFGLGGLYVASVRTVISGKATSAVGSQTGRSVNMAYQVKCISLSGGSVETITHLGGDGWKMTVAEMVLLNCSWSGVLYERRRLSGNG